MMPGEGWTSITTWAADGGSRSNAAMAAAWFPSAGVGAMWNVATITTATILAAGHTTTMAMNITGTIAATATAGCP